MTLLIAFAAADLVMVFLAFCYGLGFQTGRASNRSGGSSERVKRSVGA